MNKAPGIGQGTEIIGSHGFGGPPIVIFAGDGVESRLDLEWRHFRMFLKQACDDPGNMRASETVAGQRTITPVRPCRSDIDARRRQFNDLAKVKAKIERVGLFTFNDRDQR